MLLSLRRSSLDSLFKEGRVFKRSALSFLSFDFGLFTKENLKLPRIFGSCRTHKIPGKRQRQHQNYQGTSLLKLEREELGP